MRYGIVFAPDAVKDVRNLKAYVRSAVREAIETHLRHAPAKTSTRRIKRLRGVSRPQFRLRVSDVRVFYDVTGSTVEILAVVPKSDVVGWLKRAEGSR